MTGSLCVPNVGLGDIEVRFNQHDSDERTKALRMLTDMRARGYAILVRLDDGSYTRAVDIDAERGCYVVQMPDAPVEVVGETADPALRTDLNDGPALPQKRRGRRRSRIPIENAHAVGVARSAGG